MIHCCEEADIGSSCTTTVEIEQAPKNVAQVIVDIPSQETNRPFDYLIPSAMQMWLEIGSRVSVPFGRHVVQGIVIGLSNVSTISILRLKSVQHLLDVRPALLPDLIQLARWMNERYVCTWLASLQVMLPRAMKSTREKVIRLSPKVVTYLRRIQTMGVEEVTAEGSSLTFDMSMDKLMDKVLFDLLTYVECNEPITLAKLLHSYPAAGQLIKHALQQGWMIEAEQIKNQVGIKRMKQVKLILKPAEAKQICLELGTRALRQQEVIHQLLTYEGTLPLKALPASAVKALQSKGIVTIHEVEVWRDPYANQLFKPSQPLSLTQEQQAVVREIMTALDANCKRSFLLHGVTGSGKTEVYLQAIAHCLQSKRAAIVLVPEISLTPQMVERFKSRFGSKVAVLHSRLSHGERYDEWRKIREKRVQVAIGVRSAIFAPFSHIGLIVIDEEHETSYKQEETPKYHARDVALERAKFHGAVVVLGSATPSIETYYAAHFATYLTDFVALEPPSTEVEPLIMATRVGERSLPPVTIVDMREQLKCGNRSMFSIPLEKALAARLKRGEQTVLLLNRRGYATFVMCRTCGYVAQCPNCNISLTYHLKLGHMRCHYCGYTERAPVICPTCASEHIRYFGTGTQRVEEQLIKQFPGIRVIRMDIDTTTGKGAHEGLLSQFGQRKADVLLGTQMVAKGLDFPYVTLVGVIAADSALYMPDFRAAEKTFQLLTQVAGRAGRHQLCGEVIVQTYAPKHYSIVHASTHDYTSFITNELHHRKQQMVPPFCRLALLMMTHEQLSVLIRVAEHVAIRLQQLIIARGWLAKVNAGCDGIEIFGPVASPVVRLKNYYRFQCILKSKGKVDLSGLLAEAMQEFALITKKQAVKFSVNIDPQMMM